MGSYIIDSGATYKKIAFAIESSVDSENNTCWYPYVIIMCYNRPYWDFNSDINTLIIKIIELDAIGKGDIRIGGNNNTFISTCGNRHCSRGVEISISTCIAVFVCIAEHVITAILTRKSDKYKTQE